jgi:hypothetical protein
MLLELSTIPRDCCSFTTRLPGCPPQIKNQLLRPSDDPIWYCRLKQQEPSLTNSSLLVCLHSAPFAKGKMTSRSQSITYHIATCFSRATTKTTRTIISHGKTRLNQPTTVCVLSWREREEVSSRELQSTLSARTHTPVSTIRQGHLPSWSLISLDCVYDHHRPPGVFCAP